MISLQEAQSRLGSSSFRMRVDEPEGQCYWATGFFVASADGRVDGTALTAAHNFPRQVWDEGRGHILTATHVADEHSNLTLAYQCRTTGTEPRGRAGVVHVDPEKDVAILQAEQETWTRFWDAGLRPPRLAVRPENALRRLPVVCLGYQDSHVFIDPIGVRACTPPDFPVRRVRIEGFPHRCLVLVISEMEGQICITHGMSGGPVMDSWTSSCEVVAMVLGVWKPREDLEGKIYQPWRRRWEVVSAEAFGFAIPMRAVAESWPELRKCCLNGGSS